MKRSKLAAIAGIVVVFALAGCGSSGGGTSNSMGNMDMSNGTMNGTMNSTNSN